MKFKIHQLLMMAILAATASCQKKSGENVKWDTTATFSYAAAEVTPSKDSLNWSIEFVNNNGTIDLKEKGKVKQVSIDATGRFTYNNPNDAQTLYELLAFSVLPPQGTIIEKGTKWEMVRPTDQEALQSDAIVAQEKISYEVMDIDDNHVAVKTTGWARIAQSQGLDSLLSGLNIQPDSSDKSKLAYQPYAEGTANFDIGKGKVTKAEGVRAPFSYLFESRPLDSNTAKVNYIISLK